MDTFDVTRRRRLGAPPERTVTVSLRECDARTLYRALAEPLNVGAAPERAFALVSAACPLASGLR